MNNLALILADGTELRLEAFGVPCHAVMLCESKEMITEIWDTLTEANLQQMFVRQGDEIVFAYRDCSVNGEQSIVNGDGTLTVHFYMDGTRIKEATLTDEDREYITAAKILLGEEM